MKKMSNENSQWKSHPSIFEPEIQNSNCSEAEPMEQKQRIWKQNFSCCDIINIQDSAYQKP